MSLGPSLGSRVSGRLSRLSHFRTVSLCVKLYAECVLYATRLCARTPKRIRCEKDEEVRGARLGASLFCKKMSANNVHKKPADRAGDKLILGVEALHSSKLFQLSTPFGRITLSRPQARKQVKGG